MQYVDYVGSWGPAIVGHAHPEVTEALHEQIKKVCPRFTALNRCLASVAMSYSVSVHLAERTEFSVSRACNPQCGPVEAGF